MAALRHLLTGFFGGELDPLLSGRVDSEQYRYGLATCENFVCVNEGPLVKRPGFEYICDADDTASWLGAFRFSITQEYAIEWGELKARFYTNGVRIETSPGVPFEAVTPYAASEAARLSTQQSYDRLYIDHPAHPPGALVRSDAVTFSHQVTNLRNGPFLDLNTSEALGVTVTGTLTVGGAVTIAAPGAGIFAASDVGGLFRIEAKDFSTIKAWEPGMTGTVIGDVVRSDGKAYTALTGGTTGTNPPVHTDGAEHDGQGRQDVNAKGPYGVQWEYRHDRQGVIEITGFTDADTVTGTVVRRVPDSLASVASHRWAFQAFSATRGWPSLVCHWGGRQIHIKDFDVVASVVGDYGGGQCNFQSLTSAGVTAADLSFRRTLAESDPPLWVAADRKLLLGTASKELAVGAINTALAVAGDNIQSEPQSFYGCEAIFPVQVGTETIFVERGARRLRQAGYDFARDRYAATDLTAAARQVTAGGVVQLAYQRVPYMLLHALRGDGQLAVHAITRIDLKGFSRTVLGGGARALSAVSIVGQDGRTDELWLLVERTRADGVKKEVWRQTAWRELGDTAQAQFYVDGGVSVAASGGQTHFTGAVHLAGQAVAVLAGGAVVPGITVAGDGSFDLPANSVPAEPYTLAVGLPYTALAVTLQPEAEVRGGTIQGMLKRARKVVARLIETIGLKLGAIDGPLEEPIDRPGNWFMDDPIPLFTGDTPGPIEADYTPDGQVRFVSDLPLAAIITAAIVSLEVDEADA